MIKSLRKQLNVQTLSVYSQYNLELMNKDDTLDSKILTKLTYVLRYTQNTGRVALYPKYGQTYQEISIIRLSTQFTVN